MGTQQGLRLENVALSLCDQEGSHGQPGREIIVTEFCPPSQQQTHICQNQQMWGTRPIPVYPQFDPGAFFNNYYRGLRQQYINRIIRKPTPDEYIKAIADSSPTVCGGGFFAYGGPAGGNEPENVVDTRHGGVQGFYEWDSRNNYQLTKGTVVEGQYGPVGGGYVFSGGHAEPLIFGGAGPGVVIFFPTSGSVGAYAGSAYGGVGGYLNFVPNSACHP